MQKATQIINIKAELYPDETPGATRYSFTLYGRDGQSSRELIVDVPDNDEECCDVWVLNSSVQVGDGPDDGFATYKPKWSEVDTV